MKIAYEISPYEFLQNESWECDELIEKIDVQHSDAFDCYVEDYFYGQSPDQTELNDFLRFNADQILTDLGFEDVEEEF